MPRLSGGAVVCFVLHVARLVTPTHTWTAIVSADSAVMNLTTSEVTSHLEHTWPDRGPALTLRSYTHRDYVAKTAAGV